MMSMRLLVLFVGIALMVFGQSANPQSGEASGRVSGRVRSSVGGEPVRKATVALRPENIPVGTITASRAVQVMLTDSEGAFSFERVAPGRYSLSADRLGFLGGVRTGNRSPGRLKLVVVEPGGSASDVVIDLAPQGVITGRVTDEDGDPIERAFVSVANRRAPENPQSVQTNDLGEFRLAGLKAGKYIVLARLMAGLDPMARLNTQARKDSQTFVTTYHPSVIEAAEAAVVPVVAGQEVRGIEIRMRRARAYRLRGRVATASASGLVLQINRPGSIFDRMPPVGVSANGMFDVSGLKAGTYELTVTDKSGVVVAMTEAHVNADLDDLIIPLVREGRIRATVRLTPPAESLKTAKFRISLTRGEARGFAGGEILPEVETPIEHILPGRYRVRIGMPEGVVLKSVLVDGKPAPRNRLNLNDGSELVLVMSTRPGAIEGTVADYRPGESSARVLLMSPEFDSAEYDPESVKQAAVDQSGKFRFRGLAPGTYRLVAAEIDLAVLRDPEVVEKMSGKIAKVTVDEGATASATLTAVTAKEAEEIEAGT